ncbi:PREDICTED: transmembrane protein 171 [Gavialis gangeticus]|uniref:transmembrane protein 171 n=1 Tax=Gavialis gangeticus TaxID=94835 RepID=UPI00092F74A3|nr:PREDICTED: transmembrane protein 171 [Gavialis gangeticus]XP_019373219.1 PREDICTED: transmembrane protein 171 [Gavialis gangeticus]
MYPVAVPVPCGEENKGHCRKFIFFISVFGVVLLCAGFLLLVFIFQSCPSETSSDSNAGLKAVGLVLSVAGLACALLVRSREKFHLRQRQLQNAQVLSLTSSQRSCQSAYLLIFGFLVLTSGILIGILGIWVPSCSPERQHLQLNQTIASEVGHQGCGFLSLQIVGPFLVLTGLCLLVIAYTKRKQNLNLCQESSESEGQPPILETFQATADNIVMALPPPPYFIETQSLTIADRRTTYRQGLNENPRSYHSLFNNRAQLEGIKKTIAVGEHESIYTISRSCLLPGILRMLYFSSELPPSHEEKALTIK